MGTTIKEFLVGLAVSIDQSSVSKANAAIDSVKAKANSTSNAAGNSLDSIGKGMDDTGKRAAMAANETSKAMDKISTSVDKANQRVLKPARFGTVPRVSSVVRTPAPYIIQAGNGPRMGTPMTRPVTMPVIPSSANDAATTLGGTLSRLASTSASTFGKMGSDLGNLGGKVGGVIGGFNSLGGAVVGALGAMKFTEKAEELAEFNNLTSTFIPIEAERLQYADKIYQMSQKTASSYAANKDLVADIASNMFLMGKSSEDAQHDALGLVGAFRQAGMLGTQATGSLQAAVLQLKQAVAKGVLQGDELRSLKTTAPKFIEGITKAMGFATEKGLQDFASKGNLTIESILQKMPEIQAFVDKETMGAVKTPKQMVNVIENLFDSMFDHVASSSGVLQVMTTPLNEFYNWLMSNQGTIESFFDRLASDALPRVASMLETIGSVGAKAFDWITQNQGPAMTFIEGLLALGALVTIITPIMGILSIIGGILAPIGSLLLAVAGAIMGPIGIALAVLALAGKTIYDNWGAFMQLIKPGLAGFQLGLKQIKEGWDVMVTAIWPIVEGVKLLANVVGAVLMVAIAVVIDILGVLFTAVGYVFKFFGYVINEVSYSIKTLGGWLGDLIDKAVTVLKYMGLINGASGAGVTQSFLSRYIPGTGGGNVDNSTNTDNGGQVNILGPVTFKPDDGGKYPLNFGGIS